MGRWIGYKGKISFDWSWKGNLKKLHSNLNYHLTSDVYFSFVNHTVCPVKFGTVSGETKFSKNHRNSSITIFQVFNTENVDSGNNELNWYFESNTALFYDFWRFFEFLFHLKSIPNLTGHTVYAFKTRNDLRVSRSLRRFKTTLKIFRLFWI